MSDNGAFRILKLDHTCKTLKRKSFNRTKSLSKLAAFAMPAAGANGVTMGVAIKLPQQLTWTQH